MSHLTLQLKSCAHGRINLQGVVPDRWREKSLAEILAWPIEVDRRPAELGQVFDVYDGDRDRWLVTGNLAHCDFIAAEMRAGEIVIEGNVGDYLASGMRGGSVVVSGDAGAYAASGLRRGSVTIKGNTGPHAAGAAPFQSRGMAGGELVIEGSADQWLASRMRRGLVVVQGDVASGCATRMIAGTLVICGRTTAPIGCGMVRGTLVLFQPHEEILSHGLLGFTEPSPCQLSFLPLLLREIAPHIPTQLSELLVHSRWLRCVGDRADLGLGEVLLRACADLNGSAPLNPS